MKNNMIKYFFVSLLLFALLNSLFYTVYANDINLDITSDTFSEEFKPGEDESGITEDLASPFVNTILQIVNPILGIIQVIGFVLSVISISFFGLVAIASHTDLFNDILPTSEDQSPVTMEKYRIFLRNFMVGAIFLTSATTIAKIIFDFFMKF